MNDQNFVFTHKNGKYLNGNSVYAQFKKIVKAMGIGETRLRDLRHPYVKHTTKKFITFFEVFRAPS